MKKYIVYFALLVFLSCKKESKNFEFSTPIFEYSFHDTYSGGINFQGRVDFIKKKIETGEEDYDLLKKKIYYNVRTLNVKFNIKNITGENIETAKLYTTIKFFYENQIKEYNFDSRDIYFSSNNNLWYNNETKSIDFNYNFNFLNNYDENVFKHKPKKITATISLKANNSVGFNVYETLYDNEISISNFE